MEAQNEEAKSGREEWLDEWFYAVNCPNCRSYIFGIHCTGPGGCIVHAMCRRCRAGIVVAYRPMKPGLLWAEPCQHAADGVRRLRKALQGRAEAEEILRGVSVLEDVTCKNCGKRAFGIHCAGPEATVVRARCANRRCRTWVFAMRWDEDPTTQVFHATTPNEALDMLREHVKKSSVSSHWESLLGLDDPA